MWRSRILHFASAPGLRPTSDRIRQTVFNWLGQELHGQHCLDLFAGTGALGFEAASRGAEKVVMVELNPLVYRNLLGNAQLLKADQIDITRSDALQWLAAHPQKFDVIFLDPPFGQQWLDKVLPLIPDVLDNDGLLYVEAEYALTEMASLEVIKHGKAGNVFYHLLKLRHGT